MTAVEVGLTELCSESVDIRKEKGPWDIDQFGKLGNRMWSSTSVSLPRSAVLSNGQLGLDQIGHWVWKSKAVPEQLRTPRTVREPLTQILLRACLPAYPSPAPKPGRDGQKQLPLIRIWKSHPQSRVSNQEAPNV